MPSELRPRGGSAPAAHPPMVRALLPPLTIALAVVTAATLLLMAASITPPPVTSAVTAPSPPPGSDVPRSDSELALLMRAEGVSLPPTPAVVDLARLTYAPGAGGHHALPGPLLLAVESGTLTVQLDGMGQVQRAERTSQAAPGMLVLRPGDALVLPTATGAAFANAGSQPVVALAAGVFSSGVVASRFGRVGLAHWAEDWSPGASVQPLAGGWLVDASPGPATITLERVSVRPGDQVPLTAPGPADLAVETGALTLEARGGLVWQQHPVGPNASVAPASAATLLPGDAALLQEEASVSLRNAGSGPLLVLMLTVEPAKQAIPLVGTPGAEARFP
jgi:hypothetical protein